MKIARNGRGIAEIREATGVPRMVPSVVDSVVGDFVVQGQELYKRRDATAKPHTTAAHAAAGSAASALRFVLTSHVMK